jgi:hypothetical protein
MKADEIDRGRRRILGQGFALGFLMAGAGWGPRAIAAALQRAPARLAAGRSIYELRGDVSLNGKPIDTGAALTAAGTLRTGSNSYLIYAVGSDAFLLRENSELEMGGDRNLVSSLRLAAGRLLSVFGKRSGETVMMRTTTATIGIRGTGVYAESYPDRTYLCTCYGRTELASAKYPDDQERIESKHHDAPRWILGEPEKGKRIIPAGMVMNHTDEELRTLEALVGRDVPFSATADYERPRREY